MNSTSPAPKARPQRAPDPNAENRSSVLRTSILESALELGVGSSRTVANWIFNAVEEGDEEDNTGIVSPSLTYASTATSASEESNLSVGRAQQQQQQQAQPGAGITIQVNGQPDGNGKDPLHLNLDTSLQFSQRNGLSPARLTPDTTQRTLQFDLRASPEPRAISPAPSSQGSGTKNKLRKPRPDGYESDGGYMSEGGKAKKEKEKEKKEKEKKSKKKGKDKDGKGGGDGGGVTDYESDGGYLSEASAKRKKSKKEKKEKEKPKSKSKPGDSLATDYETDKGYTSSFTRSVSRKQSLTTSPVSGDDSDGGYLSESSKKRRFFRINSKSRKKQDSLDSMQDRPPPVPALPEFPLPIHEMFSRATSPMPRDGSSDVRPSVDTVNSASTITTAGTTTSMDTSLTLDTTSTTVESDEMRESPSSTEGLTRAFADAESVRSPSIDLLSAFRRPAGDSRPSSPLSPSKFNPFTHGLRPTSPLSPKSPSVPALSPSKSIRARPKISAPNTTTLAPKHIPVPLTLTPPTPTTLRYPSDHIPPSPDGDYVLVTPNPYAVAAEPSSPNGAPAAGPPPSPKLQRPKVLAYYDLPPPSPPPRGPLPDVPQDISRSTSPSWSVAESSRLSRSAPADTNDPRHVQQHLDVPIASPPDRPNNTAHPLSREITGTGTRDAPTIAQPVPSTQRGRMSPFPTAPLLPREQTTLLMRKTSTKTREAVNRALNHNAPASASPYLEGHGHWSSHDQVRGPASAHLYPAAGSNWPAGRHVRFAPPRSASALDTWRPEGDGSSSDDGRSWMVFDDDENGGTSDQSLSVPATRPGSAEPASPDANAILAGFRAQRDAELSARKSQRRATQADTLAGIVAGYERETVYLDVEEGGGDRASVWSEANSRHSFLDSEKSAAIREKFVQRVEAMYGKDIVPPMPRLDPGLSSRSG